MSSNSDSEGATKPSAVARPVRGDKIIDANEQPELDPYSDDFIIVDHDSQPKKVFMYAVPWVTVACAGCGKYGSDMHSTYNHIFGQKGKNGKKACGNFLSQYAFWCKITYDPERGSVSAKPNHDHWGACLEEFDQSEIDQANHEFLTNIEGEEYDAYRKLMTFPPPEPPALLDPVSLSVFVNNPDIAVPEEYHQAVKDQIMKARDDGKKKRRKRRQHQH